MRDRQRKIRPNDAKLRELILYVAERCENDPDFGALKLNKILFNADFIAYALTGKAITGASIRSSAMVPHHVDLCLSLIASKHKAMRPRSDASDTATHRTVPLLCVIPT